MSTSLPKWEEAIRNAGSTEACLREAIRQIKCLNDMRPHDGLGYEINDVIEVANSIKGKNGNAAAMRDALEGMCKASQDVFRSFARETFAGERRLDSLGVAFDKAQAALSAPARNCDRFADETDAQIAFLNEVWLISVTKETALERDRLENWTDEMRSRYAKWLLAPAAERKGE